MCLAIEHSFVISHGLNNIIEFIQAFTFIIDTMYVNFGDTVYHQTIDIPSFTHCAPLLADLYLYTY